MPNWLVQLFSISVVSHLTCTPRLSPSYFLGRSLSSHNLFPSHMHRSFVSIVYFVQEKDAGNDVEAWAKTPSARSRLWGLRSSFSLSSFVDAFLALGHRRHEQMPLLAMLTDEDTLSVRLALPHLPAALQWVGDFFHKNRGVQ